VAAAVEQRAVEIGDEKACHGNPAAITVRKTRIPRYNPGPMSQIDRRLKNVQQADLTESRVNDDFVHWLRTWGSNVLLVVLLVAAAAMGYYWWSQKQEKARDDAWGELGSATLPAALDEVAAKHEGKDAVAVFAKLKAADQYAAAVVSGTRFDRDATAADAAMTPELRTEWLKEADKLYADVATRTAGCRNLGEMGFHLSALFGRAACAEDQGDLKAAEGFLTQARDRAKDTDYADVAEIAGKRIASLQQLATRIDLPKKPVVLPPPTIPNLGITPGAPGATGGVNDLKIGDQNASLTLTPSGAAPAAPAPAPADAPKQP
jgi:predicted negative regulator of RcsB-dependent stress response